MCSGFGESGLSFPPYIYIIGGAVHTMLDFGIIGRLCDDTALVAVRLRPVGSIIGMFASRIG